MPVPFTEFRPSRLRTCWHDGTNLKPSCTTSSYSGGAPSAATDLKPSICDHSTGNIKKGLTTADDTQLKPSLLAAFGGPSTATLFGDGSHVGLAPASDFRGASGDVRVRFRFNIPSFSGTPKLLSQRTNPSGSPFDVFMNASGQIQTRINDSGFAQTLEFNFATGTTYNFIWDRIAGNASGGVQDVNGQWVSQFTPAAFSDDLQSLGQDRSWVAGEPGGNSYIEGFIWEVETTVNGISARYPGYAADLVNWPGCDLVNVSTGTP